MTEYVVSSDPRLVDRERVWRFLHEDEYWAAGVPREAMDRAFESSLCFSAFDGDPEAGAAQVGFVRVVTDKATFAWIRDVFVVPGTGGRA